MKSSDKVFNPEQEQAITHGEGPLLIIAGAGTGKTAVVTERIRQLILLKKIHPQQILALTFTEKASREMEDRIDKVLPFGMTQLWISTFHSFCDRILKSEGIAIGINPGYRLMNEADAILFFRSHLFEFSLTYYRPLGNPFKFIDGMIQHFSRLKDEDITPAEYQEWVQSASWGKDDADVQSQQQYQELAQAYAYYEKCKVEAGMMDYSDLISYCLKLFRERPNILKKYQEQFEYLLVDEFQDTNVAQNQLLIMLAGKKKNITAVGDDDQSIYKFRGAAISNMITFRKSFPKAKVVVLTKNYRSTKEILDRSYDLIQFNNPDRLEVAEKIDKKLESMRRVHGDPVQFIFAERVEDEAEAVAKQIGALAGQESLQWGDFAILVRANAHALPFTRSLERYGIPYQFLGPGQLLRQAEVKDLIAYLMVLARIDDTVSFYRVLTMDWLAIDVRDVASLVAHAKRQGISLYESCLLALSTVTTATQQTVPVKLFDPATTGKLQRLMTMVEKHLGLIRKDSAGQILYYFLEETGLLASLVNVTSERTELVALNIAKFFDRLKTYEVEHIDASVFAVVDWITLSLELGESPLASNTDWNQKNAVNILTVHSSKGLEFPVVFITNLVSARFPSIERKEQIPIPDQLIKEILPTGDVHLQEERRLCYVAMTRARDRLFLTAAKYYGDGKREKKISPFIAEAIGEQKVDILLSQPVGGTKQLTLLDWAPKTPMTPTAQIASSGPTYLSYSQIDTFLTCPLQYKYRYVLKLPVPPSAALVFGDTIHKTLEQFYHRVLSGTVPTINELLTIYEQSWRSVGFGNKHYEQKMKIHGIDLLQGYYQHGYQPGMIPKQLEEVFKIKLTPRLTLGGKIDRIDTLPDKRIEIIDYKTGQSSKIKKNVKNDLQLSVYAMAAADQGIYGYRLEDVIVSFYFLETQEKISGTRTEEQITQAKATIIETADKIRQTDFRPTPGKHCDFCEFRMICEAWQ